MSDWSEVGPGYVVVGKDGHEWTCTGRDGDQVTLSRPGREPFTGSPTGPVQIVSRPDISQQPGMAQALLAVRLGAVAVSKQSKDKTQPHLTPVDFPDPATMLAHLYIFHGNKTSTQDIATLRKEHAALHHPDEKASDLYEPHLHDPDFDRK